MLGYRRQPLAESFDAVSDIETLDGFREPRRDALSPRCINVELALDPQSLELTDVAAGLLDGSDGLRLRRS